jgi:hypothetical protein
MRNKAAVTGSLSSSERLVACRVQQNTKLLLHEHCCPQNKQTFTTFLHCTHACCTHELLLRDAARMNRCYLLPYTDYVAASPPCTGVCLLRFLVYILA